jgi:hypothetical protein
MNEEALVAQGDPQQDLPLIGHVVEQISIDQRANDGYINATAMCKAAGESSSTTMKTKQLKSF